MSGRKEKGDEKMKPTARHFWRKREEREMIKLVFRAMTAQCEDDDHSRRCISDANMSISGCRPDFQRVSR